jgi:hypothetical protein
VCCSRDLLFAPLRLVLRSLHRQCLLRRLVHQPFPTAPLFRLKVAVVTAADICVATAGGISAGRGGGIAVGVEADRKVHPF